MRYGYTIEWHRTIPWTLLITIQDATLTLDQVYSISSEVGGCIASGRDSVNSIYDLQQVEKLPAGIFGSLPHILSGPAAIHPNGGRIVVVKDEGYIAQVVEFVRRSNYDMLTRFNSLPEAEVFLQGQRL